MSKSTTLNQSDSKPDENRDEICGSDQQLFEFDNGMESIDNSTKPLSFAEGSDGQFCESNIIITDRGGLKWQGNLEDLRLAVDRLRLHPGTWSSPGGHCKLFENGEVSMRWYSNNGTLTVKGDKAEEIKQKLLNLDRKTRSETVVDSESPKVINLNSILQSSDANLHMKSRSGSSNTDMTQTKDHSLTSTEFYERNSKSECHTQNIIRKLDSLAEEISIIKENKENKAYAILVLEDVVKDLKMEKQELKRENGELKEQNKNLLQSLTDARAKVLELQEEKSSLLTALKLIQREQVTSAEGRKIEQLEVENKNLRAAARTLQEDIDKTSKGRQEFTETTKQDRGTPKTHDTSKSYVSKNQYQVLCESDQDDDVIFVPATAIEQPEVGQHEDIARDPSTNLQDGKSKHKILLIGDSMIKNIDPHKLSKNSVRKLTFPGKRAEEMANDVQTAHINCFPTEVIIHAGTNNLITDSSKECCENIQHLSNTIKSKFKDARIAISSIINRKDVDLESKIEETNKLLKELCLKQGYTFIDNDNLDATCLNGSKLHLNAKGSALLAVHFIKFLRKGQNPRKSAGDFPKQLQQLGELLRVLMPQTTKKRTRR